MSNSLPDRRAWLDAAGLLQIFAGACLACFLCLGIVVLSAAAAGGAPPVPGGPWIMVGVYGPIALGCIVVGVGCLRTRRWARALSLIASWGLVLLGFVEAAAMLAVSRSMPSLMAAMPGQGASAMLSPAEFIVIAVVALLFFGVPGIVGVLFFGSASVKKTVERCQPEPSWTDACPLDVLATSLAFGSCAIVMVPLAPIMPLAAFGRLFVGPAAICGYAIAAILLASLAWGLYRRTRWAGPLLIATMIVGIANSVLTMRSDALDRYYVAMGYPAPMAAASSALLREPAMVVLILVMSAATMTWMLHILRRLPWRAA